LDSAFFTMMRSAYRSTGIIVPELAEVYRLGHVIDTERYFLYSTVVQPSTGTVDTLVFLEKEVEGTGGDSSAIDALLAVTTRRTLWARDLSATCRIPWLTDNRRFWKKEIAICFETEALAFLQRRVGVWREVLSGKAPELVNAVETAFFETAVKFEPDLLEWLHRSTLSWLRRLVEDEIGFDAAAELSHEDWATRCEQFAVNDRPRRLELKAVAVDLLYGYTKRLAQLSTAELRLTHAETVDDIRALLKARVTADPAPVVLPRQIPQYTFMEARNLAVAIADGPTRQNWRERLDEATLEHVMPKQPVKVRLAGMDTVNGPDDLRETYRAMSAQLRAFDLSTVLLLHVAIELVLSNPGKPVLVDDLIRAVGWSPRSSAERTAMREQIWEWVQAFDAMAVHGRRPGVYVDPVTKKSLDLTSEDALVRVIGKRFEAGRPGAPPVEITLVAGPWLDAFRGNSGVLQHFGDIRKIAEIAGGKPSGAWARSIGLALNQLWRERANRAEVLPVESGIGDRLSQRFTAMFPPFTRLELLNMFRAEPWVEDVLAGDKPGRAREYWDGAIRKLRSAGVIGHYAETPSRLTGRRKGWQETWLHEDRLDIRPKETAVRAIAALGKIGFGRASRKTV
jgi:hypothetical protein